MNQSLIDKTNIDDLHSKLSEYESWLTDNTDASIKEYERVANLRARITVKIDNYMKLNINT